MSWRSVALFLRSLFDNFAAAFLMLLGFRRAFHHLHATPIQLLTFMLGSLLTSFTFDFITEGWPGSPDANGFTAYLVPPLAWLVFGVFLAQRYALWRLVLSPVILWLAADILVGLFQSGIQWAGQSELISPPVAEWIPQVYLALFAWPTLAVMFLFGRQLGWTWWRRLLGMVVAVGLLSAWSSVFSDQRLWYADEEVEQPTIPHITEEAAFYTQPLLLNRALAQLQAGVSNQIDWYFLGVAGSANQSVFRHEVESVQSLFDTRFTTSGHSMVLINDDDTTLSQPIATQTSIARALNTIGERMNPDEDVLFLFLTSHGSSDGTFELNHPPLQIASLNATWLRQALDDAHIRRRVIVISACYSGTFIPQLQTPDTVIITASAANKTSFGCTDDADFTYFGRAFFDEAMRQEHSFANAFKVAQVAITQREKEEEFIPSEPQMVVGENMKRLLPALEATLFPPP